MSKEMELALLAFRLIGDAVQAFKPLFETLQQAHEEGRDINPEEIAEGRKRAKAGIKALSDWLESNKDEEPEDAVA